MQNDQNITYTETQKLDLKKWILIPMGIAIIICIVLIGMPVLYFYFSEGSDSISLPSGMTLLITAVGGCIPLVLIFAIRRRMKLILTISKKGLHYSTLVLSTKKGNINWDQVTSIGIKKYPYTATRPGEQARYSLNNKNKGNAFIMTTDYMGIELKLKDGSTVFFTSNDVDELAKAIRKLELDIPITK